MTLFDGSPDRRESIEDQAVDEAVESIEQAAPKGPLVRVGLGLSYDGSHFHGFAAQPGIRTVAGELTAALGSGVIGASIACTCAGRTDAGVHARAQVVHVDLSEEIVRRRAKKGTLALGDELPVFSRSLSRQLGSEITVWRALIASPDFDARHCARSRRYRYDLDQSARKDPLHRHDTWQVGKPLDLAAMRLGSDPLIGEHDFGAFCRRPKDQPVGPIMRRVTDVCWQIRSDGRLRFEIEANAFCHQMVRSIVGALVAIGSGRARPSDMMALLRTADRTSAPQPAPPHGLCLIAVRYPETFGGTWA